MPSRACTGACSPARWATHETALRGVFLAFGVGTALVGGIMCFAQRHFKRLLAFSTIAHTGILVCAFALFRTQALGGMWLYILGHGLAKGALFIAAASSSTLRQ